MKLKIPEYVIMLLDIIYIILVLILLFFSYRYNFVVMRNLFKTIGGRVFLLLFAIFGFTINVYVGLIVLIIIFGIKFIVTKEGLENPVRPVVRRNVVNTANNDNNESGVDRVGVSETIRGKNSRTLANTSTSNSEDVEPFSSYNSMF